MRVEVRATRLKALREARGLTQRRLAHDLGISQNYIPAIEAGARRAGPKLQEQLTKYFRVLLGGDLRRGADRPGDRSRASSATARLMVESAPTGLASLPGPFGDQDSVLRWRRVASTRHSTTFGAGRNHPARERCHYAGKQQRCRPPAWTGPGPAASECSRQKQERRGSHQWHHSAREAALPRWGGSPDFKPGR